MLLSVTGVRGSASLQFVIPPLSIVHELGLHVDALILAKNLNVQACRQQCNQCIFTDACIN